MTQPAYVKASLILEAHALWQQIQAEQKGSIMMEAKQAKPDFLDVDKDGDRKEPMKQAIKQAKKIDEKSGSKPDFLDLDKDGNKKEPMKQAAQQAKHLDEKWDADMKTAEKDVGKWEGYTIAELKARKKKLMDKAERSAAEQKEVRQINFAIRAKQENSWGKIKEVRTLHEDANLDKAETLLAAKAISDRLQKMAEDAAKMAVDDLMPLVDTMKSQFGLESATAFNNVVKQQLQSVLDMIVAAKDQTDNAITTMETGGTPTAPSDIAQPLPPMGGEPPVEAPPEAEPAAEPAAEAPPEGDVDFEKEFAAMPTTSGPEEAPLGREKKTPVSEMAQKTDMEQVKAKAAASLLNGGKDPDTGKPVDKVQAQKILNMKEAAKKPRSPYAVGMAKAMELTGDTPPLKKSTITKAHEIARSIQKDLKEQQIVNLTAQARALKEQFDQLSITYKAHKATQSHVQLAEQMDLESAVILENMKKIKHAMEQVLTQRRDLKQELAEQAAYAAQTAHKITMLENQLSMMPYGVKAIRQDGVPFKKFFENADLRNTWISYNEPMLTECELIDPAHVQAVISRLKQSV